MDIKDHLWLATLELSLNPPQSREISMVKLVYRCRLEYLRFLIREVIP